MSGSHFLKLEERLTCPICLGVYRNPKALPCQHSFCQDCLMHTAHELVGEKYLLRCPSCRKPAQLPDGGVPTLPSAFTVNSFLELHQEMLAKQGVSECPRHKKPLEAFCNSCQQLVCFACATRQHSNHGVKLIDDLIHDCKQQVEEGLRPVKKQISIVVKAIEDLDTFDRALVDQGEVVEQQIHSQAQEARAALDQAEMKLIQEVRVAAQQKRAVIGLQKQEAQNELAQLQSTVEYIERRLESSPFQQIVSSKSQMLDHLKKVAAYDKSVNLQPAEKSDLRFVSCCRVVEECRNLGVFQCSHLHQNCHLLLKPVATGTRAYGDLSICCEDGFAIPISTNLISCQLTSSWGPQPADCSIREKAPGKYEISYTPVGDAPHKLRVMVGGSDIPGSVFSVPFRQVVSSHEISGDPLRVISNLSKPMGVAISKDGEVIVTENDANCLTFCNSGLKVTSLVEPNGSTVKQLKRPQGVALTKDGRILVADSGSHQVLVMTIKGGFVKAIGGPGARPLQFNKPVGIAVHCNGQVLVSELNNDRIQVLNKDLTFSHFIGSYGSQKGKFNGPYGIAIDNKGVIFVADWKNNRVQKLSMNGKFISQFGLLKLNEPMGLAIDSKDRVYVSHGDKVSVFTSDGRFLKSLGWLSSPRGMAVDEHGCLYVCDTLHDRVVLY